jgi:hypothetical protein
MTRLAKTIATAILAVVAAGCGSSGSSSTAAATSGGGSTVNGCTKAMATDKTTAATFEVTSIQPWEVTHQACVRVKAGTEVSWKGNFTSHPLVGGSPPKTDAASVITTEGKKVMGAGEVVGAHAC